MLSMKYIAAVKTAIEICNDPDLKKEILCAPGSDYDINKENHRDKKSWWYMIVEKKATAILERLGLTSQLKEIVISIIFLVGMRMLLWAAYHEGTIGLSREYSVKFLKNSFFTPQGRIDNVKAAEELIKDESLNIKQKYNLACLYCFIDHIPVLFRQMTTEDKIYYYDAENPRRIKQPEFVKFWSYYLMSEIDRLKGERNLDQYRLAKAVRSGSKAAVEYCLEKTKLRMVMNAVVDAAVEAVRCRISVKPDTNRKWGFQKIYECDEVSRVPSDYYVDILCFLFSKMGKDQQIDLFKKEFEVIESESDFYGRVTWALMEGERIEKKRSEKCSIVLEYFLNWPYQDYFMKTAKLMWEFLPESYYAVLLLMICDKIESKYGEGKSFDYRELLKEFWCQSPDRYKRRVFKNEKVTFRTITKVTVRTSVGLIIKLLSLKNFTYEDEEIIKLLLASATSEEKENIISAEEWTAVCVELMAEEKWETLDRYIHYFFSKEMGDKFKRELSFRNKAQTVCIDFVRNDNWNAAESFIKWSSLPEQEIKKLKELIIYSLNGRNECVRQIFYDKKVKAVDKFIRWYLPSEEVKAFKRDLILSNFGTATCADFVIKKQEFVTEFINFCLSSEEEVRELKKSVAYKHGGSICKVLISDNYYGGYGRGFDRIRVFDGGQWEEVEKFLTYCFSYEEEIRAFKRNNLLAEYGQEIHFELIISNQWEEAETFFAWLGLSVEEVKDLKRRTLSDYRLNEMFERLIYSDEDSEEFLDYGNKQEAIELLLRWYLTDREMTLEWKDKFFKYLYENIDEENEVHLKNFDLMIKQRLIDIDEENRGVKRATETISPNKMLCTTKLGTLGMEWNVMDEIRTSVN